MIVYVVVFPGITLETKSSFETERSPDEMTRATSVAESFPGVTSSPPETTAVFETEEPAVSSTLTLTAIVA